MTRFTKKISKTIGLPPGTVVPIGEKKEHKPKITVIDYDEKQCQVKEFTIVEDCFPFKDTDTVSWINIDGIHDVQLIEKLGAHFNLHPLTLEDIVNTSQRPKTEEFDTYLFVVLKMLYYDDSKAEIKAEQISLIVSKHFVILFQEQEGDVFNPIRERIKSAKGRIRKMSADYLAYALLDAIVDNYFIIIEKLGENIESIEEELVSNPVPQTLQIIHELKQEMIFMRKAVWPLREVISGLIRSESPLLKKSTSIYLRDLYDHTIQVIDTIETFRDMVSGMLDIYISGVNNKMNEVMKVLTIIATIFIPITFVAGIYGMNFNPDVSPWNMPELNWRFGYFIVLGIMMAVVVTMLFYFRRKKWL